MDYSKLFSKVLPARVEFLAGLTAETRYVFLVTYTDPDTLPSEGLSEAMRQALR